MSLQPCEAGRELSCIRQRPLQQREDLLDCLWRYRGIPCGSPFPDQETHMPHDAVFAVGMTLTVLERRGRLRL